VSHSSKRELLTLVEALCEETASAKDISRLEELVLKDAGLRRLYTEAIMLHGLLHWDAAGCGAELESSSEVATAISLPEVASAAPLRQPQHATRPRTRFRRLREIIVGLAVLVILKLGFALFTPEKPQLAQQKLLRPEHTDSLDRQQPAGVQTHSEQSVSIPGVRLPRTAPESVFSERRVEEADVATNPTAAPSTFQLSSDDDIIRRINHHLRQQWNEARVEPAPVADDAEWIRRVYLDLAGRIPTGQEAEAFFHSASAQKREELVVALVSSRDFSRRLATVWTNLLVGRSRQSMIDRESLLSWLDDQFFAARPWREMVTDLVAARGTSRSSGPANFLLAHLNNEAVPATAITSRIFLCEQLQCAQCHQHPTVKSWGQERFWELNAFFQQASIRESTVKDSRTGKSHRERELVDAEAFGPTYYETLRGVMRVAYPRFAGVEINQSLDQDHPSLRAQLARLLFTDDHPQPARAFVNRTWALLMGHGFTFPVDDMGPHTAVSHPELLEDLTAAFVQSDYNVQRLIRWICLSDAYHFTSRDANVSRRVETGSPISGEHPLFNRMSVKRMSAEQLFDSLRVASGMPPERLRSHSSQQQREAWLQQFYFAVDTEENGESSTFDGSWQQALLMINGELVQQATSPEQGSFLALTVLQPDASEADRIRLLSLAALSRYPSPTELSQLRSLLRRTVRQRVAEENLPPQRALAEGLKDVYWAYLNSSEFTLVH